MSLWQAVGEQAAAFTLLLSDAVQRSSGAYLNPLGVGAVVLPQAKKDSPQFGLYLDAARVDLRYRDEPRWIRLEEIGTIKDQLFSDFADRQAGLFLERGWAFVAPPPILHASTGDVVIAGGSFGTLGAEVRWGSGYGILTAGHVAGSIGSTAYTASPAGQARQIGSVVFSRTAAGAGPRGGADIGLIELAGTMPIGWAQKKATTAQPLDKIEVQRNSGPVPGELKGIWAWLAYPNTNIVFANTYQTVTAITQPGDSGAVAIHTITGEIVGHVVGGTGQVASYIQEIDYQLRAIAAQAPFASISL
ncbi:MAG: hypothetical protein WCA19_14190 [Candidatus Acidiferrales bacterium]